MKAKGQAEGCYHQMIKYNVESNSHLIPSCSHMVSCLMDKTDYNYKLRSVIGHNSDFIANKWTWFNKQVRAIFLWSCMLSRALVDYINMGKMIGRILDNVYTPCVPMNNIIWTISMYFYTSMVIHPGSNNYLQIHNLIHRNMLSFSSKIIINVLI